MVEKHKAVIIVEGKIICIHYVRCDQMLLNIQDCETYLHR